jgi:hypothetical protein
VLTLLTLVVGLFLLVGVNIYEQSTQLQEQLREAVERFEQRMSVELNVPWTGGSGGSEPTGANAVNALQLGAQGFRLLSDVCPHFPLSQGRESDVVVVSGQASRPGSA